MLPEPSLIQVPLTVFFVKATSELNSSYIAFNGVNLSYSLIDGNAGVAWYASSVTGQRFHINFGVRRVVTRIYLENAHSFGGGPAEINNGIKDVTFWGSNAVADFNDVTYANDGTWKQLPTSPTSFAKHVDANVVDPQYMEVANPVFAFQYYALKIATNWGGAYLGIRRMAFLYVAEPFPSPLPLRGSRMR